MTETSGFAERLRRIETGKQIQPEGIVMRAPPPSAAKRSARATGHAVTRVSMTIGMLIVCGAGIAAMAQHSEFGQELAARIISESSRYDAAADA